MSRGSRGNYWSSSKFSKWIQRTFADITKPNALGLGEWGRWKKAFESAHPFVYWFTEEFLDKAQDVWMYPVDKLDDFRYWGYNRFVSKPHMLQTKLEPGKYYEIDQRMLHGLFETLVEYIEVEKAWMMVIWNDEARDKYQLPWYKRVPYWLRWREWRCPEAGVDHLKWEMTLVNECEWMSEEERAADPRCGLPTHQAISAKEQYELYNWWKNVRPLRPDPMDAGGWSAYCNYVRDFHGDIWWTDDQTPEEAAMSKEALDKTHEIEEAYDREDEEMMIRLIKVRRSLWT